MHFHLPKPLHGWRAFAGEVGIIVIGVLIALSAEQVVEDWRSRVRTDAAREQLRHEVSHQFEVMEERDATAQCIDEQLTKAEDAMLSSDTVLKPLPLQGTEGYKYTVSIPPRSWTDSAWQSILLEGLSEHLTRTERELLPIHYSQMRVAKDMYDAEDSVVGELTSLAKPLPLDPQVKAEFVRIIEVERTRNAILKSLATDMMRRIRELSYVPTPADRRAWLAHSGTLKFCREHKFTVPTQVR